MLEGLLTEQPNPASSDIDRLPTEQVLRTIHAEDCTVAGAVTPEIPNIVRVVDATVAAIRQGGRLFYIGAGTSGRLGVLDAAECTPTFNVPGDLVQGIIAGGEGALARASETSEDDSTSGERDLLARSFGPRDVLVGIAASGRTPYVIGAVNAARRMGAFTAGISCTPGSELARAAEVCVTPLTGPEIIAGSTRMKAGTATKLVLNMISTAVMIRLGYVHRNLMVNVRPVNEKLRARARRIVAAAGDVTDVRAAELLESAAGDVRTAILMARLNIGLSEAQTRLEAAGGRVSEALGNG